MNHGKVGPPPAPVLVSRARLVLSASACPTPAPRLALSPPRLGRTTETCAPSQTPMLRYRCYRTEGAQRPLVSSSVWPSEQPTQRQGSENPHVTVCAAPLLIMTAARSRRGHGLHGRGRRAYVPTPGRVRAVAGELFERGLGTAALVDRRAAAGMEVDAGELGTRLVSARRIAPSHA